MSHCLLLNNGWHNWRDFDGALGGTRHGSNYPSFFKIGRGDWPKFEPSQAVQPYVAMFLHPPEPYSLHIGQMMRAWV